MIEIRNKIDFNEYLESLLSNYECDDVEFKSANGGFPGSFWETYSAFANTDGGLIVLGVAEKDEKFYLDGLTDGQIVKYKKDFWNNVNNKSTISCNLLSSKDVVVQQYKGYNLMLFFIPRATRSQRPVYRTTQPFGGTFKRNNEGDYKCSDAEVRRMFADADETHPADSRILKNYTIDDIDLEALDRYRQLFKVSSPDHPWLSLSNIELLKMLGGYRKDRQSGDEGFTVAGLLMFGKSQSITDVECCPNFFPDYQERMTEDEDVRWTNRICADGTWEANLFNFYQRVLPRLQSVLPKPFKLENNIRKDETPAHIAVREALINLCVHADYSINASLVVKHNLNGFVFSNPGTMLVSKDQYYSGGESVCRNKSLQKMFAMLGVAEKAGSGTDKIINGWKDSNWRSPKIEEQMNPDKIVLIMPMESLLSDKTKATLNAKFGISANAFDHNAMSALALACDEGFVTNERLRYVLKMHKNEISEMLKLMVQRGMLMSEGHGRGTRYVLPMKNQNLMENYSATFSDANMATSDANVATSGANVATSDTNVATSGANVATSDTNVATSDANVATSSLKKRLPKEQLNRVIIDICSDWKSLDEIALESSRDAKYLRVHVIKSMLQERLLEMLYPGNPNHPRQKYKKRD